MKIKGLQVLLCAGVAMAALSAKPASASVIGGGGGPPPEFKLIETCNIPIGGGCGLGHFTVVNNSGEFGYSPLWVWGFSVGNPRAAADGTSQPNWSASVCHFFGSGCGFGESTFDYSNNNGASSVPGDLANDVGPGSSSSNFTWGTFGPPASPVDLSLVDGQGNTSFVEIDSTHAPEPISAALLGSGLVALGAVRRRRRG